MPVYVMGLDSNALMPANEYYIWYKGLYLKYNKSINPVTQKQDYTRTDSFLTISAEDERTIWRMMAEFARAWAYANDLRVRVTPGVIFHPGCLQQIKKHKNEYRDFRTLTLCRGFMQNTEFLRIANVDTEEKSELLRLYTIADANPDVYFKTLFFWHTIVYPSKNEHDAVRYINSVYNDLQYIETQKNTIHDGTFGEITNNDIGSYIQKRVRNAIGHICRNSGVSIIIDDVKQQQHLRAVADILKAIAKEKLDKVYNLNKNAPREICRLFDPDTEFGPQLNVQDKDIDIPDNMITPFNVSTGPI